MDGRRGMWRSAASLRWRDAFGTRAEATAAFAIAAVLAGWVAIIGPFGNNHAGPLPTRLAYHLSLSVAVVAAYHPAVRLAGSLGSRVRWGRLIAAALAVLLVSIPMSGLVAVVAGWFFPHLRGRISPLTWYFQLTVIILPIALGLEALRAARAGAPQPAVSPKETPPGETPPALRARLPRAAGDLLAVEADDHYVRVHTTTGAFLLRLTMAEAMRELDGAPGLRTHRSWWVAFAAIEKLTRRGRGGAIRLTNGSVAPAARARMAELKGQVGRRVA